LREQNYVILLIQQIGAPLVFCGTTPEPVSEASNIVLSSYASGLPVEAKSRYLKKVQIIGGIDPFVPLHLDVWNEVTIILK